MGFDHDAGTFVSCSDRVDPRGSQESERRPVTHCQAVSEAAGSDGSCVQRDIYWPAVHETPTVVAQDQGVFPEGKPASYDQGHVAVPTCLRHVETALVLVSGSRHSVNKKGQGLRPGEWMLHPEEVKQIWRVLWPGSGGPLRYSGKYKVQCPLWYSLIHPAPLGLDAMVQTWPTLRLYVVPRSLCSREFWRECAGTRSVYFW